MRRTTTISAAAAIAAVGLFIAFSVTPIAQAPATQAPRQGRGGNAGDSAAPARKQGDGAGPFKKMVIRSVTLIDGTGGPPLSPMDIVIEGDRITAVRQAGWSEGPVRTPEKAREWVRWAAANNIDGIKFFNRGDETPEIDSAAIDEAHMNKMGTVAHLSQNNVAMFNARQAGDAHLDTVTHYYGHFESLLKDKTIQEFPVGYDYNNEQDRFGDIARIWNQTYEPGSKEWVEYLEHQKANHVTFDPTFNIYAASRDLMRARNADWHQTYTMPQLWNYFQSTRDNHGSYFYDWTTENEGAG